MNIGLYQAVSGMKANQQYQELLAANLASQAIAGNRGNIASFAVNMPEEGKVSSQDYKKLKEHPFVKMNVSIDTRQGALRETGNPFNVAITGNGFFVVQEPDGRTTLTRNGQFQRNQDDELVTLDGAQVMLEGNQPLRFPSKSEPSISQGGEIKVDGQIVGQLARVRVNNPEENLSVGPSGRYISKVATTQVDKFSADNRVMQGYLEDSNINPVEQMVNMMQVTRLYEAGQKAIEAHDQSTQKLIQASGPR